MNLKILTTCFILSIQLCFSQELQLEVYSERISNETGQQITQYGLKERLTGKIVVKPQYDFIDSADLMYNRSYITVTKLNKKGLIDRSGRVVIECKVDDLCEAGKGIYKARENKLWGFIDTTGVFLLNPKYLEISNLRNNSALALTTQKELIIIDIKGTKIGEFNVKPVVKDNFKLELLEPKKQQNFYNYFEKGLVDSLNPLYNFHNCADGEGFEGKSYRKLKYGIILISKYGWESVYDRYLIPNYSQKKAISLLKKIYLNSKYLISKEHNIIKFYYNGEHIEIEETFPNVTEIRYSYSS